MRRILCWTCVALVLTVMLSAAGVAQNAATEQGGQAKEADLPKIDPEIAKRNLIRSVRPEYPPLAKQARVQGVVRLSVVIDEEGKVENVGFISGHPMLAPAAVRAVRQWQYNPFEVAGKSTAVQTTVELSFPEKGSK